MARCSILFVILSLAIQSYDSSQSFYQKFCDEAENCADYELGERLRQIGYLPTTEQQLNKFCPSITKMIRCVVQQCAAKNIFSSNSSSSRGGNSMISAQNIGNIVLEICTDGSELQRKYLSDICCIKGVMLTNKKTKYKCLIEGHQIMLSSQIFVEGASTQDRKKDASCMSVLNFLACLTAQTGRSCGRDVSNTVQEILTKVKLLKWLNCNEAHMHELRTKLMRSPVLREGRKEIFSTFF